LLFREKEIDTSESNKRQDHSLLGEDHHTEHQAAMSQTSEGVRNQQPTRPPHRGPPHHTDKSQGGAMNSSDAALAKKWRREGMCRKCGKVKTHTGFLMKKLVSGSRTFWFRSDRKIQPWKEGGEGGSEEDLELPRCCTC
jgi:hypothetical protein